MRSYYFSPQMLRPYTALYQDGPAQRFFCPVWCSSHLGGNQFFVVIMSADAQNAMPASYSKIGKKCRASPLHLNGQKTPCQPTLIRYGPSICVLANLAIWRATNHQIGDFGGPYLTIYCEIAILADFGSKITKLAILPPN